MKAVDLYARVRRACHVEGMSQRQAARAFGIDPKTVAKMLRFSVPPGTDAASRRRGPSSTRSLARSTGSWKRTRDARASTTPMSQAEVAVEFPPEELARIASLRYVVDEEPGYTRQMNGNGFVYSNGDGKRLRDKRHITRIESLAIPPAWTEVWICRYADGHLQATGRDDRGRKQYLYHEHWRKISNAAKFWRLKAVPKFLPDLRRKVLRDLARPRALAHARPCRHGGPARCHLDPRR